MGSGEVWPPTRKLAREEGVKHYFTGSPCKHGHNSTRLTSTGYCDECNRIRLAKYRLENRDEMNRLALERYHKDPEKNRKRCRDYYRENSDKERARKKASYDTSPEKNRAAALKWYHENKDRVKSRKRKNLDKNGDAIREAARQNYAENIERNRDYQRKWRDENRDHLNRMARERNAKNPEKRREYDKERRSRDIEKARAYDREQARKRYESPKEKLNRSVREMVRGGILSGSKHGRRTAKLLGYSIEILMAHLETKFQPGMAWENYGKGGWEVDHVIPLAAHNFETPDDIDFKKAWALSNLRPMWGQENQSKGAKLMEPFQPSLALAIPANDNDPSRAVAA